MFGSNKNRGFDATKLKAALRLASSRFDVAKNKKSALMKQNMREVATLLAEDPPQEEKAKIRTERLIKDDYLIEAYEILQLECQLLTERVQLLKHSKSGECPQDLVGCVSDLIYAAPRVEIPELQEIRNQLVAKFGKSFAMDADNNKDGVVSQRIVEKLSLEPPTAYLVQNYMINIAKVYEVSYEPTAQLTIKEAFEPVAAPVGYSVPVAVGTGLGPEVHHQAPPLTASSFGEASASAPSAPPTNPDFKKGSPTVVTAFAYDPSAEADSKEHDHGGTDAQTGVVASPSSAPQVTSPTAPTAVQSEEDAATTITSNNTETIVAGNNIMPREIPKQEEVKSTINEDDSEEDQIQPTKENPSLPSSELVTVYPAPAEENNPTSTNKMELHEVMTGMSAKRTTKEAAPQEEVNHDRDADEENVNCEKNQEDEDITMAEETPSLSKPSEGENIPELHDAMTGLSLGVPPISSKQEDVVPNDDFGEKATFKERDLCDAVAEQETNHENDAAAKEEDNQLELLRNRLQLLAATPAPAPAPLQQELQDTDNNKKDLDDDDSTTAVDDDNDETNKKETTLNVAAAVESDSATTIVVDCEAVEVEEKSTNQVEECTLDSSPHVGCFEEEKNEKMIHDHTVTVVEVVEAKTSETTVVAEKVDSTSQEKQQLLDSKEAHNNVVGNESDEKQAQEDKEKKKKASEEEYVTGAALAGGAVGFAVGGSLGGILGAAGGAHLAANKSKGKASAFARKCGKKVTKMTNKLVQKM